jgi:hypothetical protein
MTATTEIVSKAPGVVYPSGTINCLSFDEDRTTEVWVLGYLRPYHIEDGNVLILRHVILFPCT